MEKRSKVPWFMDLTTHRFKLGIGLGLGGLAAGLMLLGFGVSPLTVIVAAGTLGGSVGQLYLIDYLGRKYCDV